MPVNANSDNRVADILSELRHHFKYCRQCQSAYKTLDYDVMCARTKRLIMDSALAIANVIPRRIKAKRDGTKVFYACPDLSAHSQAYRVTAEPLVAVGIQDSLF